jgi:hypothetical protein
MMMHSKKAAGAGINNYSNNNTISDNNNSSSRSSSSNSSSTSQMDHVQQRPSNDRRATKRRTFHSNKSSSILNWTGKIATITTIGSSRITLAVATRTTPSSSSSFSLSPSHSGINDHQDNYYHNLHNQYHHHYQQLQLQHSKDCVHRILEADTTRDGCLSGLEYTTFVWETLSSEFESDGGNNNHNRMMMIHQSSLPSSSSSTSTTSNDLFFNLPLNLRSIFLDNTARPSSSSLSSKRTWRKGDEDGGDERKNGQDEGIYRLVGPSPTEDYNNISNNDDTTTTRTSWCDGIELDKHFLDSHLEDLCRSIEYYVHQTQFFEEGSSFKTTEWITATSNPHPKLTSSSLANAIIGHPNNLSVPIVAASPTAKATATATTSTTRRLQQTFQQCKIALAIGDGDRDNVLTQEEYVRYIDQLSGQQDDDSESSFADLPSSLQSNYAKYEDPDLGGIDIAGSKPGQTPTEEQDEQINSLCDSTIAILNGDTQEVESTKAPAASTATEPTDEPPASTPTNGDTAIVCTDTIPRNQCNTALAIADLSQDNLLNDEEFVRFVNRLSSNQYDGDTFETLPENIKGVYDKFAVTDGQVDIFGSKPGQTADEVQDEFINDFCCETDVAVANPGDPSPPSSSTPPPVSGPTSEPPSGEPPTDGGGSGTDDVDCTGTVDRTQCNTALSIADLSRDDLLDESEYVRFINRLSNNEYSGQLFSDLPGNIQDVYDKFATTDSQIDVFGSKPGQSASSEQDEFLDGLCCETDLAVQNPGASTEDQPTMAPQPSEAPGPTESLPPTFGESYCRTSMASVDFNRDDLLNEEEYVLFLNRLTSNQFADLTFDELDVTLQQNFETLIGPDDQINIFGSKPGQSASDEQEANLDNICLETAIALNGVDSSNPPPVSTAAPVTTPSSPTPTPGIEPTFPPTFAQSTCYTAMASSDFSRDDYMNEEEYVRFLNRLWDNQYEGFEFKELPQPLQDTYNDLASDSSNGEIYIFGSKPGQTATEDQEVFLDQVCLVVAIALDEVDGEGTLPPASSPSTKAPSGNNPSTRAPSGDEPTQTEPSFPPGLSEVYNSFIVANSVGLKASDLQAGANRDGLNDAYGEFALKSLSQITSASSLRLSYLRRRKLVVDFAPGSDEIYLLVDSSCPDDVPARNTCQTAFGKFQVTITDEDPQELSDEYTGATQVLIADGLLQTVLTEVDPRNILTVVNASSPVTSTLPPTPAPVEPTDLPTLAPAEGGDGGGGSLAGSIIGGVIGGLLLCAAIGYVSTKGLPCSLPSFVGRGGRGKQADDEDDGGFGQDDDGSVGEKDGFKDDRAQEQSRDEKNVFGFGKKNKSGNENDRFGDNEFGVGSDGGDQPNSFGKAGGMYAFDEPSEIADKSDDQGSIGGNDDMFGGSPESPGWGNSKNLFASSNNQGWGVAGTDATNNGGGDNFFGTSAFGKEEAKREDSRSGSDSDSYTSSEDSTYQSDGHEEEEEVSRKNEDEYDDPEGEEDSYSRSSADDRSESSNSESSPATMQSDLKRRNADMDTAIENEDWDAVAKAANSFGKGQDSSIEGSSKKESDHGDDLEGDDENDSYSGSSRSGSMSESGDASGTSATTTSEQNERRAEFRAQVDALVRLVLPDETDKVDAMMKQFKGREAELVSTLQTMQERSANQRARAAVHKSKTRPQRADGADGVYSMGPNGGVQGGEGSAAGTAAIAAASLPIPAAGMFDDGEDVDFANGGGQRGFGGQDAFGDDNGDAEDYEDDEEQSYYSDEDRSRYSGEDDEEGTHSDEGSGSRTGSRSGSRSDSASRSRRDDDDGPFSDEGSRSQYSDDRSRSRRSGEEEEEGSRSRYSGDGSKSYYSEDGSRSHYTGEEDSQSQRSGEDSREERSGDGSRSRVSGEDGPGPYSDEDSRSRYSDEQSGSRSRSRSQRSNPDDYDGGSHDDDEGPFSDEGSQYSDEEGGSSRRSGDERSYDDDDDEAGSFNGTEEEGSFNGTEEDEEEGEGSWD